MDLRDAIQAAGGLASQTDLAERLGLSKQRLSQLVRRPDFPSPVGTVGGRPVWLMSEVETWRQT